jgi:hypothetical protein
LKRAGQWLLAAEPTSAEERGMRLMGLVWTDAPRAQVQAAIQEIRHRQEASGGWSQFGRTSPDAYATGLSLYAHPRGRRAPDRRHLQEGVSFLLGSAVSGRHVAREDPTRSRCSDISRSGFPYGRHQWISMAGTSWASLAIAQTLPDASHLTPSKGLQAPSPSSD